jgi:hypothetical protein
VIGHHLGVGLEYDMPNTLVVERLFHQLDAVDHGGRIRVFVVGHEAHTVLFDRALHPCERGRWEPDKQRIQHPDEKEELNEKRDGQTSSREHSRVIWQQGESAKSSTEFRKSIRYRSNTQEYSIEEKANRGGDQRRERKPQTSRQLHRNIAEERTSSRMKNKAKQEHEQEQEPRNTRGRKKKKKEEEEEEASSGLPVLRYLHAFERVRCAGLRPRHTNTLAVGGTFADLRRRRRRRDDLLRWCTARRVHRSGGVFGTGCDLLARQLQLQSLQWGPELGGEPLLPVLLDVRTVVTFATGTEPFRTQLFQASIQGATDTLIVLAEREREGERRREREREGERRREKEREGEREKAKEREREGKGERERRQRRERETTKQVDTKTQRHNHKNTDRHRHRKIESE